MYIEKIKVMNMISNRTEQNGKIMELVQKSETYLEDLKFYFPNFIFYLWERPKIMAFLLKKAQISDIKNYLAPLIVNNFYENILSPNFIEENLIYVLTLLLEEEINNLSSPNENIKFLDDTKCGYLLEELRKKKDVQTFFKNVILDSIENLETNYSNTKLNFIPEEMNRLYMESIKSKGSKFKIKTEDIYLNQSEEDDEFEIINYRDRKDIQNEQIHFNMKYIPSLDKESVNKFIEEYKVETNESMFDLYSLQLKNLVINYYIYIKIIL